MQTKVDQIHVDLAKAKLEIERLKTELLQLLKGDAVTKNDQFIKNLQANTNLTTSFCEVLKVTLNHLDSQKAVEISNGVVSFSDAAGLVTVSEQLRIAFMSAPEFKLSSVQPAGSLFTSPAHVHSGYRGPVYERD